MEEDIGSAGFKEDSRVAPLTGGENTDFYFWLFWCHVVDSLQTSAEALHNNYTLKELVEDFNLSGELPARAL